jgi:RNA polymerase primary sigma factor
MRADAAPMEGVVMFDRLPVDIDDIESSFGHDFAEGPSLLTRTRDAGPEAVPESLSQYLKAISRIPLLTKREEQVLALRVRRGDPASKERMIGANLRLVVAIARRYRGMGLPLCDLIGEGNIGLIKAVERFKHEKGFRFSTYASKWIRQAITKALATDSRTVRLPANVIDILRKVRVTEQDLVQSGSTMPSEGEVCDRVGITFSRYAEIANASSTVSLDAPCTPDGEVVVHDLIADSAHVAPDDDALSRIENTRLEALLSNLSKRERVILSYRFGLEDGNLRSLAETGKMVGITRERIRQIEKRAIQKMRTVMKKRRMQRLLISNM